MKPALEIAVVIAGYLGAILVAVWVTEAYSATDPGETQISTGRYAFGDGLVFLAVFSVAAVLPHGAALFFLRAYPTFWRIFSGGALVVAASGIAALVNYVRGVDDIVTVLRILLTPLLALTFFVAGVLAPTRGTRVVLFVTTAIEAAVFGSFITISLRLLS